MNEKEKNEQLKSVVSADVFFNATYPYDYIYHQKPVERIAATFSLSLLLQIQKMTRKF